ncbi:hypothetical protein [Aeoliella sp. SH292]|uniref:hypothetical protein n=1 Tax=Aeoliella sp. SH292 TaxID=3454464 RepID=UPI003F9E1F75
MNPTVAKAGQMESVERRYHGWSGKLGVVLLLGGLALAFGLVSTIVFTTPLSRNDLGLLGGLKLHSSRDIVVFVGDRRIGTGANEVKWNDLLGATNLPPLAVPVTANPNLAGEGAELIWSQQGPTGVHRGEQDCNYSFREELYRRADGSLDHLFVIDCEFPNHDGEWHHLLLPIRARSTSENAVDFFPQAGTEGGGQPSRGMIPSRRDNSTFQLNLEARQGAWPTSVDRGESPTPLWQPAPPAAP